MNGTEKKLEQIKKLFEEGLTTENTLKVFDVIGIKDFDKDTLESFRLWGDYLPIGEEIPYTQEQRYLHILWEVVDGTPLGINCAFSIPFRAMIAKKLFKKCGDGFIANEGCRFNYGHLIEVGNNVSWNHGCYIDSKGGVKFGDFSIMTEYSKIFTHGHSEGDHEVRTYAPVEIGEYAKIYTACTILPGVKIGAGAIVATGSIVTKSVPDFTMVAGIPAKAMRERRTEGKRDKELNHYMFCHQSFQGGGNV